MNYWILIVLITKSVELANIFRSSVRLFSCSQEIELKLSGLLLGSISKNLTVDRFLKFALGVYKINN